VGGGAGNPCVEPEKTGETRRNRSVESDPGTSVGRVKPRRKQFRGAEGRRRPAGSEPGGRLKYQRERAPAKRLSSTGLYPKGRNRLGGRRLRAPALRIQLSCASYYLMSYPSFNEEALGRRTWVIRLTGPRKGRRDQSMPEKRGQARSAHRASRETRAARSELDCTKPNPDRGILPPLTTGRTPQADSVRPSSAGPPRRGSGKSVRWDTGRDIPGVGMSGRPKPRSDV
jgi:hypothetical protein